MLKSLKSRSSTTVHAMNGDPAINQPVSHLPLSILQSSACPTAAHVATPRATPRAMMAGSRLRRRGTLSGVTGGCAESARRLGLSIIGLPCGFRLWMLVWKEAANGAHAPRREQILAGLELVRPVETAFDTIREGHGTALSHSRSHSASHNACVCSSSK